MDDRFEKLKNSVMFNLSLSSKELFHSNFLSFLFKKNNDFFFKITGVDKFNIKEIKREHKNIDIEIIGDKEEKYLIENKVKDIIGEDQIKKILEKNKDYKKYYLFSLLGNNMSNEIKEKYHEWEEIGYEKIISKLKIHNFNDDLINKMKDDYCVFMENMIKLLEEQYKDCDNYQLYRTKGKKKNELFKQYENIRLHDVFQK